MGSNNERVVMLPFMAHGHLIPFLALARQIHSTTGFTITIANTPFNIKYLSSTITSPAPNIHLVELPFSAAAEYDLPPNTENTENLPLDLIGNFLASSTSLKNPVHNLLSEIKSREGKPPICVISDVFFGWANDVAKSLGTVNLSFSTGGAYGSLGYFSLWVNLPHRQAGSDEFQVPGFPDTYRFHVTQLHQFLRKADGTDVWSKFMGQQISLSLQSCGLLCNTIEEIEPLGLDLLRKYVKIPVWCVDPLLTNAMLNDSVSNCSSSLSSQRVGKKSEISTERCSDWLQLQNPASVLYISFGSQNSISPPQMMELAIGLEKSGKPFIWVIRPPFGFDRKSEFRAEWLPEGFEDRINASKQGLLVKNWAPQLEILTHKSTGGFMSHCGWNSAMESLSQGVPIIGWPLAAEQPYNCKMMVEEMGVCVELTRGLQGNISWQEVKNVIEMVMDRNGKGEDMRNKAIEISKLMKESAKKDGSSVKALNDLVKTLLSNGHRVQSLNN